MTDNERKLTLKRILGLLFFVSVLIATGNSQSAATSSPQITLTWTASSTPDGTVSFYNGTTLICTGTVANGVASCALPDSAVITATYTPPVVPAPPVITLASGTYTMPQTTTITDADSSAAISWCYAPTKPCTPNTAYKGAIWVSPAATEVICASVPGSVTACNSYVTKTAAPTGGHVVLLIEENHTYAAVLAQMPYLMSLGNQYAHTSDYHADTSGSLMDYLWLSSGSAEKSFGCSGGGCTKSITDDNIFRELDKAGVSWKSYMESLPSVGYMGSGSGLYVKRHNPAPWYTDVINSSTDQKKIVPSTQFAADVASGNLPNYSILVPNLDHDAHNGTLTQADSWLSSNMPALLKSKYFQPGGDGVLIITFDECDAAASGFCGGQQELVYTAVVGPNVKSGFVSSVSYKHENTLRTILDLLGVSVYPGASATAAPMSDMFQ